MIVCTDSSLTVIDADGEDDEAKAAGSVGVNLAVSEWVPVVSAELTR
jgi:hypothetical protein